MSSGSINLGPDEKLATDEIHHPRIPFLITPLTCVESMLHPLYPNIKPPFDFITHLCYTLWHIWLGRNKFCFQHINEPPHTTKILISKETTEYLWAQLH